MRLRTAGKALSAYGLTRRHARGCGSLALHCSVASSGSERKDCPPHMPNGMWGGQMVPCDWSRRLHHAGTCLVAPERRQDVWMSVKRHPVLVV